LNGNPLWWTDSDATGPDCHDRSLSVRTGGLWSLEHGKTRDALARFWLRARSKARRLDRLSKELATKPWAKTRASPQGVAARTGADFVARLANIDILAAPRFASSPILAATHACFAVF
jgi:hypothetical protein